MASEDCRTSSVARDYAVPSFDLASEPSPDQTEGSIVGQAETTDEFLLIYCPTLPGFSLKDKMWGKILPWVPASSARRSC
jgi:hypothetical protein